MENINKQEDLKKSEFEQLVETFGAEFIAERDEAERIKKEKAIKKEAAAAKRKQQTGSSRTAAQTAKINKTVAKQSWKDSVVRKADELCVAREKFETETLARSNKELYSILSRVYSLFQDAVRENCLKDVVLEMKDKLAARNVRVQKNTNAITVFVRYVFNSDRKRAYNYTSTLMAALQAEIEPDALAAFIESKNGVEECKKVFRKKEETVQKEVALADAEIRVCKALRSMKAQKVVKLAGANAELADGTDFVFVIARKNENGDLELLQTVSKTTLSMQNAAVRELAKFTLEHGPLSCNADEDDVISNNTVKLNKRRITAKSAANMSLSELQSA